MQRSLVLPPTAPGDPAGPEAHGNGSARRGYWLMLVTVLFAGGSGGCFSTALHDAAADRTEKSQEVFGEPEVVYVNGEGAVAIRTTARYEPPPSKGPASRGRWVVLWEPFESPGRSVGRDAEGRMVVTLEYPDPRSPIPMQVLPQEFHAPDATADDLPEEFHGGARFDCADAPQFVASEGPTRRLYKGIPYEKDGRRYALLLTPTRQYHRWGEWERFDPLVAVLAVPAQVLDILTAPIQLPFYLYALSPG